MEPHEEKSFRKASISLYALQAAITEIWKGKNYSKFWYKLIDSMPCCMQEVITKQERSYEILIVNFVSILCKFVTFLITQSN